MACYYTGSELGDLKLSMEQSREATTHLARMLCYLCQFMDYEEAWHHLDAGGFATDNEDKLAELQAWWSDHKQRDTDRVELEKDKQREEALREQALDKLTLAERKALGL